MDVKILGYHLIAFTSKLTGAITAINRGSADDDFVFVILRVVGAGSYQRLTLSYGNVTWPVKLLSPRHIEHLPVHSHEDPRVLSTVIWLQLRDGKISLFHFRQRFFLFCEVRLFVPAYDFVEEKQAETEQSQI